MMEFVVWLCPPGRFGVSHSSGKASSLIQTGCDGSGVNPDPEADLRLRPVECRRIGSSGKDASSGDAAPSAEVVLLQMFGD